MLNENIKKYRKEAGLTQKALASRSGLSFSMISKLESGEQLNPSFETLKKIADVLKINPANLVDVPLSIEEQIDEYIAYKRGLNKNASQSTFNEQKNTTIQTENAEEPYVDLNFRKKIQAINTMPRPREESEEEYLNLLEKRPEMKKLFSASKNATIEEIEQVIKLFETFQRESKVE